MPIIRHLHSTEHPSQLQINTLIQHFVVFEIKFPTIQQFLHRIECEFLFNQDFLKLLHQQRKCIQVCDVEDLKQILDYMMKGEFQTNQQLMKSIFDCGYMAYDITNTFNQVIQNYYGDRDLQFKFLQQIAFLKAKVQKYYQHSCRCLDLSLIFVIYRKVIIINDSIYNEPKLLNFLLMNITQQFQQIMYNNNFAASLVIFLSLQKKNCLTDSSN